MNKGFKLLFCIYKFKDHFNYPKIWLGKVIKKNTSFLSLYTFYFVRNLKKVNFAR